MADFLLNSEMRKLYYLLKQRYGKQLLLRQPEMDQVMYDVEQDHQYTLGGEVGSLAILYELIVSALNVLAPARGRALDIACGSGQLLSLAAGSMPEMQFTGVDLSPQMLSFAQLQKEKHGVENLSFKQGNMYHLIDIFSEPFDLITWNLALHHCDCEESVLTVLNQIATLLKPEGTLFIFDINRPKTGQMALFLADYYNRGHGDWFYHDSLDSYKAAFTFEELESILQRSKLMNVRHLQPLIGNFFQAIYISSVQQQQVKSLNHLKGFTRKLEYALLRTMFRGLPEHG